MRKALMAVLAAALLLFAAGCGDSGDTGTAEDSASLLDRLGDFVKETTEEIVSSAADKTERTTGSLVDRVASGDISVAGFGGHPRGFMLKLNAYALDVTNIAEVRQDYSALYDQDGTFVLDMDGEVVLGYGESGLIHTVYSTSEAVSAYKGVKVGMKRKDVQSKLGDPLITDDNTDYWIYDRDGNKKKALLDIEDAILDGGYVILVDFKSSLTGNGEATAISITNLAAMNGTVDSD